MSAAQLGDFPQHPVGATPDDLRRRVQLALAPPPPTGPGKGLLDKLVLVAILVTDAPTVKSMMQATGLRASLLHLVLDDLLDQGDVIMTKAGIYGVVDPLNPPVTESELTTAWRALELTVNCPKCGASVGQPCVTKTANYTNLHFERRAVAVNEQAAA